MAIVSYFYFWRCYLGISTGSISLNTNYFNAVMQWLWKAFSNDIADIFLVKQNYNDFTIYDQLLLFLNRINDQSLLKLFSSDMAAKYYISSYASYQLNDLPFYITSHLVNFIMNLRRILNADQFYYPGYIAYQFFKLFTIDLVNLVK